MNQDELLHWVNMLFLDGRGMELDPGANIQTIKDLRDHVLTSDSFLKANPVFAAREAVWALRQAALQNAPIKLSVGSASIRYPGWISTDLGSLDITDAGQWAYYFHAHPVSNILAEHVLEHLTWEQNCTALKLVAKYLKPGGRIRIAVPDGLHPDPEYIDYVKPGGHGDGSDDHKLLFTWTMMKELIEQAGLQAVPLEYFDEQGQFQKMAWSPDDGMILRSADHDERNQDGKLAYTSLIMDGIKAA